MKSEDLIHKVNHFGAHNYFPLPVVLAKGEGSYVWDTEGNRYLDFLSCYSALNFGHRHPKLVTALKNQADKLSLCSRAFYSEELCLFAEESTRFCNMDRVLPMNSGAEAVETAIKLARKWGYEKKGVSQNEANIIVMQNCFHGRTVTLISFSSEKIYKNNFGPFTPGFILSPFDDVKAVETLINKNTVAVLVEPIQAEAGILVPKKGYLKQLQKLCLDKKVLLVLDEIQTGLGRTGKDFCFQHEQIVPDILILGKSLGGGFIPLSAIFSSSDVMEVIHPGEHGSTFGGNPLACAIGRTVLQIMHEEKISEKGQELGNYILNRLNENPLKNVKEVRGIGALIGIELVPKTGGARPYCEELFKHGILCKETHDFVIRIAPPLTTTIAQAEMGISKVIDVIQGF